MLDPEYLAYCADEVELMFSDLETEILKDIARRIRENKYMNTSTAQYQISRAKAIGMQEEEIKRQLARLLNISEKRVADIINTASFMAVESDNLIFKEAYEKGITTNFNFKEATLRKTILKGINATNGEIRNICKTTAKTAKNLLADAMDQAYLGIQSGAFSQQEATRFAIEKIASKGIEWIDYKSGTHRRVDSAIRNAVRTGVNQTACRCQEKNFDEMGGNLVEVTSHLGARPSHAEWQGKIYWWKKPYKNYSNFEQATGYGTGEGLGGWNCRHSFFPYFEGLSVKAFEPYRKGENDVQYELDQQQRYNERKIREWKRRQAINKAGGVDYTKEARKVREWEQRQRQLLKSHPDLKRNYARELVSRKSITKDSVFVGRDRWLRKGYERALKKGDISAFITYDIYCGIAQKIEKELVGITTKDGIIITGYKTHFIDRIIGQYEGSNEPIKGKRKGVSLFQAKVALQNGKIKDMPVQKNGKTSRRYITDDCFVTLNPDTKELIQATPKNRKG